MFSKVHNSKWIEWRKIVELNFLLINYDYVFVIFCDRIKYKAKKIFIRGWKLMNNNYGTQLNIMKRYLGQRTENATSCFKEKAISWWWSDYKSSNEGKMKVIVPNETFKSNKAHLFHSFVQCIRIYTCIGNFQEGFDTRHRFDTET